MFHPLNHFFFTVTVLMFLLVLLSSSAVEGLECYSCTNVSFLANCNTIITCPAGSICHSEFSTQIGRYTLGCQSASSCPPEPTVGSSSSTLIGRSARSGNNGTCSECCETGLCNRQLCQNDDPSCTDITDCTTIGKYSNICDDVDHMKTVCRRFCGLCNLVDGGLSQWTTWSVCDVTCNNGTRTRTRMCNDPAPSNGGKACVGTHQESEKCITDIACPVPGGWGQWTAWGSCSVSCDIGMQRRDRSCSHPYPTNAGDHCYGESRDDKLCFPGACADGQWSSWDNWGSCTVTCGAGLRTKYRTCDSPAPSLTGKYCPGNQLQSAVCDNKPCMKTVAFTARGLTATYYTRGKILIYNSATLNVGGGYDTSTGYFTAPVSGTYLFNVYICVVRDYWYKVNIMAKGQTIGSAFYADDDNADTCVSGSGIAVLARGDRAWIQCTVSYTYTNVNNPDTFSGVLIGA